MRWEGGRMLREEVEVDLDLEKQGGFGGRERRDGITERWYSVSSLQRAPPEQRTMVLLVLLDE